MESDQQFASLEHLSPVELWDYFQKGLLGLGDLSNNDLIRLYSTGTIAGESLYADGTEPTEEELRLYAQAMKSIIHETVERFPEEREKNI